MLNYTAPVKDTMFLLNNVLKYQRLSNLPGYEDLSPEFIEQIISEVATICESELIGLNQSGDKQGCTRNPDGSVTTPTGFKEAYNKFKDGGWTGLSVPETYGGQGLPYLISCIVNEYVSSANMAWSLLPGLSRGAIEAILKNGTDAQKSFYVPKLASGAWTGTMNLTEPQCGTDLGLIKTKAVLNPSNDGSYLITGQKIFISCGEHDMSENIIHLVLARIEGAVAGTKGLSMFIVPKLLGDHADKANNVSCGSIEEKMGIHGSPTCTMNFDSSVGYLIGEENKGLPAMFVMMNEARLGVAVQGLSQSELAYQNAVQYAKDRLQGRSLAGATNPSGPADPIISHVDVRRMLLDIRVINEVARFLIYTAAIDSDLVNRSSDPDIKMAAEDRLGLLTPVLKAIVTDYGFQNAVTAQQVFGGHGYIRDWGMEQIVRDARIAQIYEGANGIQALDFLLRKIPKNNGRAQKIFGQETLAYLDSLTDDPDVGKLVEVAKKVMKDGQTASIWLLMNIAEHAAYAELAAYDILRMFALGTMSVGWVMIAKAAAIQKSNDPTQAAEMDVKLMLAKYFMDRFAPESSVLVQKVTAGPQSLLNIPVDQF